MAGEPPRTGGVQSVERAFEVLEIMASAGGTITLSDLAERAELPQPTIHRLVRTLLVMGYVRQLPDRRYALGPKLIRLGESAAQQLGAWSRPHLTQLVERTGETANMAVLDSDMAVYVAQVPSPHTMRMFTEVGRRVYPHCTGVGKALLMQLPNDAVRSLLGPNGNAGVDGEFAHHARRADPRPRVEPVQGVHRGRRRTRGGGPVFRGAGGRCADPDRALRIRPGGADHPEVCDTDRTVAQTGGARSGVRVRQGVRAIARFHAAGDHRQPGRTGRNDQGSPPSTSMTPSAKDVTSSTFPATIVGRDDRLAGRLPVMEDGLAGDVENGLGRVEVATGPTTRALPRPNTRRKSLCPKILYDRAVD